MRWWLNADKPYIFSVDNSSVKGMDFSSLTPDIWMVQWIEGRGEVERQDADGNNLNGLRETFIDVTPYAPLFQQFMRLLPGLLLPQAQKIQIELIIEIFDGKRQAPFHYPVAAGDYWWDASDAAVAVNPSAAIQSIIATLNSLISKVNTLAHDINSIVVGQVNSIVVAQVNANVVTGINGTVVAGINNNIVGGINSAIVAPGNALVTHINSQIIDVSNALRGYIDNTFRAQVASECMTGTIQIGEVPNSVAKPGISQAGIPASGISYGALGDGFGQISGVNGVAGVGSIGGVNWSDQAAVPGQAGSSFVPIGGTVPVPVTATEIAAIQSGIAARAQDLNIKKNTKILEVNALTTVPAVIAYDVTTGW